MIGTKQWVYLDACIVIYLVEQKNDYWRSLQQHFETYVNQGHQFVVSELTRMECLTQPLRQKNALLHEAFERFFNSNTHVIADLKRPVFDLALHLRAKQRKKMTSNIEKIGLLTLVSGDPRLLHQYTTCQA